ncbi:hypothetical protein GCM10011494_13190 [Novosphingobium endophyticum]|uniref:Uncharacterized protein n=1 Tax=Novosphingobium endophyticum TaxID=1955250 RepID=A0A916TSC4_9SPHN|nr:hypothetical protein GCM10011494_13190 [Novosphingobium endophyticum]
MIHAGKRFPGAGHRVFRAFDLDAVAARGDIDAEPVLHLHEIGIELSEQGPQQRGFVELYFDTSPTMRFGPELRRVIGTGCFAGHALLSGKSFVLTRRWPRTSRHASAEHG